MTKISSNNKFAHFSLPGCLVKIDLSVNDSSINDLHIKISMLAKVHRVNVNVTTI